ncbi:hypothetical protein [Burkholderia sp. D-99]|uniref:hypothetical protein n=1 Tax=Burkholderia sp. D-99 TaxID=2717316 RepID=UPI001420112A|nr:hypothetical protein [Burkholderia sp. D-99]NHV25186.1 hypothetical protein [Burkholderia sp. D-99]
MSTTDHGGMPRPGWGAPDAYRVRRVRGRHGVHGGHGDEGRLGAIPGAATAACIDID